MNVGKSIAIGAGIATAIGVGALVLAACGDKNPNEFAMDEFGNFDEKPKDNKWTPNELEKTWIHTRTQEVNVHRDFLNPDYVVGTRQILQSERTESMRRIFEAARGNDAVLSLDELTNFAVTRYDSDNDGVLSRGERSSFNDSYGVASTRTREVLVGTEIFRDYRPQYPDPSYPGNGNGPTGPGDDGGTYIPPNNGGNGNSPGDDGGTYVPPNNGGNGNGPGDDGGSYTPPPNNGGNSGGNGNSTDNGNPNDGDF